MGQDKIENTLFDLKMAIWHISDSRTAENLSSDLAWYIYTGRASCNYLRAFCGLSKYRINTLARKILECGCTDDVIAASKKYLKIS
jgi:hypothetical protein